MALLISVVTYLFNFLGKCLKNELVIVILLQLSKQ